MALTYADRLAVRPLLLPRIKGAVANYANYLLGGSPTEEQRAWARGALSSVDSMAERVSYYVLNTPEFISDGSGISDAVLNGVVEAAVNDHFIQPAPAPEPVE